MRFRDVVGICNRHFPWIWIPVVWLAGFTLGYSAAVITVWAALGLLCTFLVTLAVADADLTLLGCGTVPPDQYMGKTVLIVGASRGLGAALAKHLACEGAVLILAARSENDLLAVKETCAGPNSDRITVLPVDVTAAEEQLQRFACTADALHGGLDYAFLAAGSSQSAVAEETTQEIGEQVMRLNAGGSIAIGRVLLRHMLDRQHGHLVPIASMAARVPSPGQAEYCAAKHAVIGYYMTVSAEVADRGVSVTVACPGPIAGERVRMVFGARGRIEKAEDDVPNKKKVPMARCCALICRAAAHNVREAWIARHPVLLMAYLARYMPAVATAVLARVGPKRARALSHGRSGYDYGLARQDA